MGDHNWIFWRVLKRDKPPRIKRASGARWQHWWGGVPSFIILMHVVSEIPRRTFFTNHQSIYQRLILEVSSHLHSIQEVRIQIRLYLCRQWSGKRLNFFFQHKGFLVPTFRTHRELNKLLNLQNMQRNFRSQDISRCLKNHRQKYHLRAKRATFTSWVDDKS